ncbi:MAG: alpha/beta hydrolase [Oscillospiraceae bacterium]|nr:alpha/beta hydrolase [Oscillospiraceae bacterium]
MRFQEYGPEHKDVILLLHGGGLSWWNYREAAELLMGEYRVILPILDGHAGSDRPFTTIEDNAAEILSLRPWRSGFRKGKEAESSGLFRTGRRMTE